MIPREHLIGWLVFIYNSFSNGQIAYVPSTVSASLIDAGWLEVPLQSEMGEDSDAHITDAGKAVADLHAPEWGVDPLPVEG